MKKKERAKWFQCNGPVRNPVFAGRLRFTTWQIKAIDIFGKLAPFSAPIDGPVPLNYWLTRSGAWSG